MGIFDFLKKKKEDDLGDLGADLGPEPAFPGAAMQGIPEMQGGAQGGMPGLPGAPTGMGGMPGVGGFGGAPQLFGQQAAPPPPPQQMMTPTAMQLSQPGNYGAGYGAQQGGDVLASRVEVLSSKLDSLRTSIDRINDKLDYIERLLVGGRRYG
jgi:hypothetical protein